MVDLETQVQKLAEIVDWILNDIELLYTDVIQPHVVDLEEDWGEGVYQETMETIWKYQEICQKIKDGIELDE